MMTYACLRENTFIEGDFLIMPVQPGHIESIRCWRNDQLDVLRQAAPISSEQQKVYYEQYIWPGMSETEPANILVSFLYRGSLIGYGGLVHVAWNDRRAEVSFLSDTARAADASIYAEDFSRYLGLIKQLAFNGLGLHRLFTETYDIRQLHIATLEASGFVREGVLRDHIRINGCPIDSVIHGCLSK